MTEHMISKLRRRIATAALAAATVGLLGSLPPVRAAETGPLPVQLAQAAQADLIEGEVRRVDMENQKITIRHGEVKKYDMTAMTMVFRVADPAMLNQVTAGDKVLFDISKTGGAMVITTMRKAN